jgi:argininosuccinate synthase
LKKERFALAFSGSLASSAAVAWLMERHGADVVTVTVDVGQSGDLDDVRARALACGARRAHVIEARDAFARDHVVPALRAGAIDDTSLMRLADPLIAKALVDVAGIEDADAVAHASSPTPEDGGHGDAFDAAVRAADPSLRIVTPAREWGMDAARLSDYARARSLPIALGRSSPHLLIRRAVAPAQAPGAEAHLDITFEGGIPVALNDVAMTPAELIESLSLIAGQYGLGFGSGVMAPAAVVLGAAYRATAGADDGVRLTLTRGHYTVDTRPVGSVV